MLMSVIASGYRPPLVVGGSPLSYFNYSLVLDPVAYLRNIATSGTTEIDQTGNGNDGTINGGPTLNVTGPIVGDDTSKAFTNTSATEQYVKIPASGVWDGTGNFACSLWIKTTEDSRSMIIFDRITDGVYTNRILFGLNYDTSGNVVTDKVAIFSRVSSFTFIGSTSTLPTFSDDNWHLFSFGRNGSDGYIFYDGTDIPLAGTIQTGTVANGYDFVYGGVGNSLDEASFWFDGSYAEFLFFNRAMSIEEHQSLYNKGTGGT